MDTEERENALWMFRMRVLAVFVILGCLVLTISTVLVTIAALCVSQPAPKWRLCVVPALALALFALAFILVGASILADGVM